MDIQTKISELEKELQLATSEVNGWSIRKIRAEGALVVLRQLAEETNGHTPVAQKPLEESV